MTELRWVGNGSDRTLFLGLVPRISIDPRIRCPRTFTKEYPVPQPPTRRYGEVALRAAGKILGATWPFRAYVEAIKVGYAFSNDAPISLYITSEVILVMPGVASKIAVDSRHWIEDATCADQSSSLTGSLGIYEKMLSNLTDQLVQKARSLVRERSAELDEHIQDARRFQSALGIEIEQT